MATTYAVTGANGQLGRLVLDALSARTQDTIRALVRTPSKAADLKTSQIIPTEADYDRPETLVPALEGVDRLLLISGSEVGKRTDQHKAVIEAAKAAGVSFIAYTSLLDAANSPMQLAVEHVATEKLLAASGIPHVLLRNGWYVENFAGSVAAALEHGALVSASADGKFAAASRRDYAEAAAIVLSGDDTSTRTYELAGHPAFTMSDLAAAISAASGKDIPFNNLPQDVYMGILVQAGLPEGFAAILADSDVCAAGGSLDSASTDLADLIGHDTLSMKAFVASLVS